MCLSFSLGGELNAGSLDLALPLPNLLLPSTSPPNLTTFWQRLRGNKLIQQRKKHVHGQIVLSKNTHTKLRGKPRHMAGFAHYCPFYPTQAKQRMPTKTHDTKEKSVLSKQRRTFFFQAFSESWSCPKRSASDVWMASEGLAFLTRSFFSPSLVNSASLKKPEDTPVLSPDFTSRHSD